MASGLRILMRAIAYTDYCFEQMSVSTYCSFILCSGEMGKYTRAAGAVTCSMVLEQKSFLAMIT